ncbi:hypothetical protein FRC11_000177, partial [Ceratobasidium sp. 423]
MFAQPLVPLSDSDSDGSDLELDIEGDSVIRDFGIDDDLEIHDADPDNGQELSILDGQDDDEAEQSWHTAPPFTPGNSFFLSILPPDDLPDLLSASCFNKHTDPNNRSDLELDIEGDGVIRDFGIDNDVEIHDADPDDGQELSILDGQDDKAEQSWHTAPPFTPGNSFFLSILLPDDLSFKANGPRGIATANGQALVYGPWTDGWRDAEVAVDA